MFIGHDAVALAAKKAAPRTSPGTLFIAAQFVDMLWPLLVLAGLEHVLYSGHIGSITIGKCCRAGHKPGLRKRGGATGILFHLPVAHI